MLHAINIQSKFKLYVLFGTFLARVDGLSETLHDWLHDVRAAVCKGLF